MNNKHNKTLEGRKHKKLHYTAVAHEPNTRSVISRKVCSKHHQQAESTCIRGVGGRKRMCSHRSSKWPVFAANASRKRIAVLGTNNHWYRSAHAAYTVWNRNCGWAGNIIGTKNRQGWHIICAHVYLPFYPPFPNPSLSFLKLRWEGFV